jgi:aspartyl-tRNA(Asn)/glutamyl-tRNA(Gln) amidotransferase subunit C
MKISLEDVRYVAELANLELTPAEEESLRKELDSILTYIDQLNELETTAVEPMTLAVMASGANLAGTLREDEAQAGLTTPEALASAPDPAPPFFRVPRVIER